MNYIHVMHIYYFMYYVLFYNQIYKLLIIFKGFLFCFVLFFENSV